MRACGCSVVGVPHVHVVGSDGSSWVGFQPVVRGEIHRGTRVWVGSAEGTVVTEPFNGVVAVDFGSDGIYNNPVSSCSLTPPAVSPVSLPPPPSSASSY